jgi:hypothetical protein
MFGVVPKEQITANFFRYGLSMVESSSGALSLGVLACLILILISFIRRSRRAVLSFIFWLSFIGVALIEPAIKIGYPYHFMMVLPGFAGICALASREVAHEWSNLSWANKERRDTIVLLGVMLSFLWFSLEFSPWARILPTTLETLVASDGDWSEVFAETAFMRDVEIIKKAMPKKGTLSVNRNLHFFHPLTGYLPPSNQLTNLSSLVVRSDFSVPRIKEVLVGCAPNVMLIYLYDDWHTGNGNSQLLTAIEEVGIYEIVAEIPMVDSVLGISTAWRIYRKTRETVCLVS